jgi:hypothetical protein
MNQGHILAQSRYQYFVELVSPFPSSAVSTHNNNNNNNSR